MADRRQRDHQRHRQTDGETDDMKSQDRALHYSAARGKNFTKKFKIRWRTTSL